MYQARGAVLARAARRDRARLGRRGTTTTTTTEIAASDSRLVVCVHFRRVSLGLVAEETCVCVSVREREREMRCGSRIVRESHSLAGGGKRDKRTRIRLPFSMPLRVRLAASVARSMLNSRQVTPRVHVAEWIDGDATRRVEKIHSRVLFESG